MEPTQAYVQHGESVNHQATRPAAAITVAEVEGVSPFRMELKNIFWREVEVQSNTKLHEAIYGLRQELDEFLQPGWQQQPRPTSPQTHCDRLWQLLVRLNGARIVPGIVSLKELVSVLRMHKALMVARCHMLHAYTCT